MDQVRVALMCCALEEEGWGATEEAETENAGKEGFTLLMPCVFQFLSI